MMDEALIRAAMEARESAYAPYSRFAVGAALQTADGKRYTGCNVENASFGATCCAERVAFGEAIAKGERKFAKIAIVGGPRGTAPAHFCMPCGICRQVMREFCTDDFEILVYNGKQTERHTLAELFPGAFSADHLEG